MNASQFNRTEQARESQIESAHYAEVDAAAVRAECVDEIVGALSVDINEVQDVIGSLPNSFWIEFTRLYSKGKSMLAASDLITEIDAEILRRAQSQFAKQVAKDAEDAAAERFIGRAA